MEFCYYHLFSNKWKFENCCMIILLRRGRKQMATTYYIIVSILYIVLYIIYNIKPRNMMKYYKSIEYPYNIYIGNPKPQPTITKSKFMYSQYIRSIFCFLWCILFCILYFVYYLSNRFCFCSSVHFGLFTYNNLLSGYAKLQNPE